MRLTRLLIANRGEIAIRIARAATELEIQTLGVYSEDDATSLHVRRVDEARPLRGRGAAAYVDGTQLVRLARENGCEAVHPGYGFLSENAAFAAACEDAGLIFVGPRPDTLALFGDKGRARALAQQLAIPVPRGTFEATTEAQAQVFFESLGAAGVVVIKALAGGGGRGMRVVRSGGDLPEAYARCRSEARAAFGVDELYVEQYFENARHVEVQIAGDGAGNAVHFYERECSLQRQHQKVVEIAPAPWLDARLRERVTEAALRMAAAVSYRNIGTFEFLVAGAGGSGAAFAFIEANPRLQVEHTVTEEVLGIDLVQLQLRIAAGETEAPAAVAASCGSPRGFALQMRLNAETMTAEGQALPSGGTLETFDLAAGPGVRVDAYGYPGYTINPSFDSLLGKVVVHSSAPAFGEVLVRARRALRECTLSGVATNVPFLANLLAHPALAAGPVTTNFIEAHMRELLPAAAPAEPGRTAGAGTLDEEALVVVAPMLGRVVSIDVREGELVGAGKQIGVLEAMKMEHVVAAGGSGVVRRVAVVAGDIVAAGNVLVILDAADVAAALQEVAVAADPAALRPDLAEALARRAATLDAARPQAVERRHASGQRTARENVEDLCDPGTFVEYGGLILPAQRQRRTVAELIAKYPADGLVCGLGDINGALFPQERSRSMILAYDYTVFAGTQGLMNHKKTDRLLELAERKRFPIVFFAEGGGGRPGDTDWPGVAGLDVMTFAKYAGLSGAMPRVAIVTGRCFAGNAALLGCSDAIVATKNATLGMGGPAMIEGGGLGVYRPEEVGPIDVMTANGVVDVAVEDEAAAVAVAKRYLSYFQGNLGAWECADQRLLRSLVPENRLRVYDVRMVLETLADSDSVLELRRGFAPGMVVALARVEGRPLGVIASNPAHLAGAIDSDGADKAARFMQLCDAFGLPVLFLCDTPGIMVGPAAEKTALIRHAARMFTNGASLGVPFFTIVLRKGYGLGAQAMAGGSFHAGTFTVAWPTGEFGAMGIEGAVRLGFRKELDAVPDPAQRKALYERMVAGEYERGKALNMATFLELDDVIDPADSRRWIVAGMRSATGQLRDPLRKRRTIDTW